MPNDYAGYGFGNTPFPSRRTVEDRALGFPLGLLSTPPMQRRPATTDPFFGGNAPAQSGNPMEFMVLQQPHSDPFGRQLPSADPMMQQQVAQQVEALRGQMQQREQMRYGMPGPQDPQVGAMMQELESRLGGGPQWRDTTGLGGRMSRLPMPQEQQAPQGPQQDPGLLLQALQLAARNSGQLSPNNVMRGPGGTYHGDVINSSGPMQGEDWYPEYIAAAQGGADLPMIRGNAKPFSDEAKAGMAARRQERLRDTLPMAERSANVRSNAIAKSAARHGRMGIGDNAPQMDLLQRLQGMEGGGDPMSGVSYLRNRMMGGPQFAGAAFEGAQKSSLLDQEMQGRAATEQAKLMYAAAISVLQDATASPQRKQEAWNFVMQNGGNFGGGAAPALPPLTGTTPDQAYDNRWTPGVDEETLRKQWEYENPGGVWGNPTPRPPGQTQGPRVIQPSLLDILRRLEFPEAGIAF